VNVCDWRTVSSAVIAPLYQSEIARWDAVLHWDTRANWRLVEAARAAGTLPGVVVHDASGDVQGWAFYLLHRDVLQVGALVCRSPAATAAILEAILDSPEAAIASSVTLFTFADAPGLNGELQQKGFATSHYRYLQRSLDCRLVGAEPVRAGEETRSDVVQTFRSARHGRPEGLHDNEVSRSLHSLASPTTALVGRRWQRQDLVPVAELLSRAYGTADASRPFVRQGRPEDWIEYVEQLVTTRGCGVFLPEATMIGESSHGVDAVVLATHLGPGTAHFAQVAVEPTAQRAGRGRLILAAALSNLRDADYARVTLLVSAANGVANGLYGQLGFVEAGTFITAVRD
jgi:ribosomal protein S18 acetylase RimI-like enzyme